MVYFSEIYVPACGIGGENPLPAFKVQERNQTVLAESSMKDEDKILFGYENAPRFLPYKIRDQYDRVKEMQKIRTVVLENDHVKAVFLPQMGGRLYSLIQKDMGRELLFSNPVIQTANLAILDQWMAGGIEWNMGQYGHSFTTSAPLFAAKVKGEEGEEFLRMYEYERCHGLFWQMDFHLPKDSKVLWMYVRIINDGDKNSSVYWWTNAAVPEVEGLRVFAGAEEAIYLDMHKMSYGKAKMPDLPVLQGKDASYPTNFPFSDEYFFQEQEEGKSPWEAAVYPDWAFFERSTEMLQYRKMFCWGMSQGGCHWKDYLSEKGKGDYIEVQAGLEKTQRHGSILRAGESLEFVQCFGGFEKGTDDFYGTDWQAEKMLVEKRIDAELNSQKVTDMEKKLASLADAVPFELMEYGSGFGALEWKRRAIEEGRDGAKELPGLIFPDESMGEEQAYWLKLLEGMGQSKSVRELPEDSVRNQCGSHFPCSYQVSESWYEIMKKRMDQAESATAADCSLFAVMEMERGDRGAALSWILTSLEKEDTALAWRNRALLTDLDQSVTVEFCYEKALALCEGTGWDRICLEREYLRRLNLTGQEESLWNHYKSLPDRVREEEHCYMEAVKAALAIGNLEFVKGAFDRDYAYVRESETDLSRIWLEYHKKKLYQETGIMPEDEAVRLEFPVPYDLDFVMF